MRAIDRSCARCSATITRGMFCPPCDRVESIAGFIKNHWSKNREEIDGLLAFIGDENPHGILARLRAMERPPVLIFRLARLAVDLGTLPADWRRVLTEIRKWPSEPTAGGEIDLRVAGRKTLAATGVDRTRAADLGIERPDYTLGME